FKPEGTRAVGTALQPGGRIVYVALREGLGPHTARAMTVSGVLDAGGQSTGEVTVPIQTTVTDESGTVSGQIKQADGTTLPFASVGMFYEFACPDGAGITGVAEDTADANGRYQFDYVLKG